MKKIKFYSMTLLLVFALMGGAFAAWSENITVNGTVATGDCDAVFSLVSTNDEGTTIDQDEEKNVGATVANIESGNKNITCTVTNAYPGYNSTTTYTITNDGTVPIKVTGVGIVKNTGSETALTLTDEISPVNQVIDAGGSFVASVKQEVTASAEEISDYGYTLTVETDQWNN